MSEDRTLVEEATVKINSIEELKRDELLRVLETFNFARIVGLVTKPSIDESMRKLREQFDASKDGPTTGEHHSAVRSNYQKMSIGRARHSGVDRPRFMRTIYNPLWAPDIYGLRESFRAVARVRNLLGDRDINFATDRHVIRANHI